MKKGKILRTLAIAGTCLCAPLIFSGCKKEDDKFYITFMVNGETYKVYQTTENQNVTNILDPVKEGYTFEGWYSDENYENEIEDLSEYLLSNSKSNTTLYAKFTINQYTITFNTNGGSTVASITQDYNTDITAPEFPTKPGYVFKGWYLDADCTQEFIFDKMPAENITLYPNYMKCFDVSAAGQITSVTDFGKTMTSIIIPEVMDGQTITSIAENAFYNCTNLKSITIPNGVIEIGKGAFAYCTKLEEVSFGANVKVIGDSAFGRTALTNIDLTGIESIGIGAFAHSQLINITIPDSVTNISKQAFRSCKKLEVVEMGNGVNYIPQEMFYECEKLSTFVLPESIESIGKHAFAYTSLTGIDLTKVKTIEDCAFGYTKLTNVNISDSVTSMGEQVFYGCEELETAIIGVGLTGIPKETFALCENLINITLGSNVETIGDNAFYQASLQNINLTGIKTIGAAAFYMNNFTSINIPNNVTTMGENAFNSCSSLQNVVIGDGLTEISEKCFRFCRKLKTVTFGKNITVIKEEAFRSCYDLTSVDLTNIASIGVSAFEDCGFKNLVITGSVKTIGKEAFRACASLESVIIENGLTTITDSAFYWCESLKYVKIASTVTTIEINAFARCDALTYIVIPSSVTTIQSLKNGYNYSPFDKCENLLIFCEAETQPIGFTSNWDNITNSTKAGVYFGCSYTEDANKVYISTKYLKDGNAYRNEILNLTFNK